MRRIRAKKLRSLAADNFWVDHKDSLIRHPSGMVRYRQGSFKRVYRDLKKGVV